MIRSDWLKNINRCIDQRNREELDEYFTRFPSYKLSTAIERKLLQVFPDMYQEQSQDASRVIEDDFSSLVYEIAGFPYTLLLLNGILSCDIPKNLLTKLSRVEVYLSKDKYKGSYVVYRDVCGQCCYEEE